MHNYLYPLYAHSLTHSLTNIDENGKRKDRTTNKLCSRDIASEIDRGREKTGMINVEKLISCNCTNFAVYNI